MTISSTPDAQRLVLHNKEYPRYTTELYTGKPHVCLALSLLKTETQFTMVSAMWTPLKANTDQLQKHCSDHKSGQL